MTRKSFSGIGAASHHILLQPMGQVNQSQVPPDLTVAFESIVDLPTTLAGYGIADLTTRGDLLTRAASAYARLALGAAGTFLRSDGTDPSWQQPTAADIVAGTFPSGDYTVPGTLNVGGVDASDIPSGNSLAVMTRMTVVRYGSNATFSALRSNGTPGAHSAIISGDSMSSFNTGGWDGSAVINTTFIGVNATDNWSSSLHGYKVRFVSVATGTTTAKNRLWIEHNGDIVLGDESAALATSATDGFLHISKSAGPPTGTPTVYLSGAPIHIDSTNSNVWIYSGSAWRLVGGGPVKAEGNSGTAKTLDFSVARIHTVTMTGNCTFTLSNPQSGMEYVLVLTQDATGSRTYTWPAGVKWPGGTAPVGSGANKVDVIRLVYDGTNYFGSSSLNY